MLVKERQLKIFDYLKEHESASVEELSQNIFASPSTIRRDLKELAVQGLIQRSHGGAIMMEDHQSGLFAHFRLEQHLEEKTKIAEFAKRFLKPSISYFFDASTTCIPLAKKLASYNDVRVTTIGIQTFITLSDFDNVTLSLTGGIYNSKYKDFSGSVALESIKQMHADVFFFSCAGISTDFGGSDHRDAMYKHQFLKNSDTHVLLCDSSKFDTHFSYKCFDFDVIDYLVTDKKPPKKYMDIFGDRVIYQ